MTQKTNIIFPLAIVLFLVSFSFIACKKKKAFKEEDGQASVEVRNMQAETDVVLKDINEAMCSQSLVRGRSASAASYTSLFGNICGLVVDTTSAAQGVIHLKYDGTVCNGRKREGNITLTVLNYPTTKLKSYGSVVKIDFMGYRVTKTTYGNSLQFDGSAYLTNESGGSWYELIFLNQTALVETLTADNLSMTLNTSVNVFYTLSRKNTYSFANNSVTCVIDGTGYEDGRSNIENSGYTSTKQKFTSRITTPVIWNTTCGPLFPISGEVSVKEEDKAFDITCLYGVDSNGNAIDAGITDCAYGWNAEWSYKRKTKKRIFAYDN